MDFSPWQALPAVLTIYGLITLGIFLRRSKVLKPEADASFMKLFINCLYPLLIIDKIIHSEAVKDVRIILWSIPTGFLIITFSILLCKAVGRIGKLRKGAELNTFAATTGIQNYGFAAVPIIIALFPEDYLGVQFVHTLGVDLALWTVGIAVLQGRLPQSIRSAFTGPVIAVLIGLTFTFTGVSDWLTTEPNLTPLITIMQWLGASSFPIALLLVGATLSDELRNALPSLKVGVLSILMRTGVLPCAILLCVLLIPFPNQLSAILIVQAAMPAAVMPIVLSRIYGGNPAIASQVVIVTQLIGILTIPLWITAGMYILSIN